MNTKIIQEMAKFYNRNEEEMIQVIINYFYEKFLSEKAATNQFIDIKNEIWLPIPNFEGYYEASNMGRIKSLDRTIEKPDEKTGKISYMTRRGKIFKIRFKHNRRYMSIRLSKNGKTVGYPIHRIIAMIFVPNPDNKPQVNHINGIKTDNRAENLGWVNNSENILHAIDSGLMKYAIGESHGSAIFTEDNVLRIRELYASKKYNLEEIGKMFNTNRSRIHEIVKRKTWKHI